MRKVVEFIRIFLACSVQDEFCQPEPTFRAFVSNSNRRSKVSAAVNSMLLRQFVWVRFGSFVDSRYYSQEAKQNRKKMKWENRSLNNGKGEKSERERAASCNFNLITHSRTALQWNVKMWFWKNEWMRKTIKWIDFLPHSSRRLSIMITTQHSPNVKFEPIKWKI